MWCFFAEQSKDGYRIEGRVREAFDNCFDLPVRSAVILLPPFFAAKLAELTFPRIAQTRFPPISDIYRINLNCNIILHF